MVCSRAAPSLSVPQGLCCGKLTNLFLPLVNMLVKWLLIILNVKEPESEKKTSVRAGVSLM